MTTGAGTYRHLNYSGDLTDTIVPGAPLGHDAFGRPYKVLSADYEPETNRTVVVLTYASPDEIRGWQDRLNAMAVG